MKPHTYTFTYINPVGEPHTSAVTADGVTNAYKAALAEKGFDGCKILKTTFRRADTAKGANRAAGLDSNGKQLNARNLHHPISKPEMSNEKKLDLLDQVRDLLAFPDIDDNEWILEEAMKLLQVTKGVNSTLQ